MKNSLSSLSEDACDITLSAFYREALDAHAIVSVTDPAGTIIYVNELFCSISGYARDELLGANHSLLNSGLHDKVFFADMWRTIGRGQSWTGEIRNRAKDGSHYWVDTSITPVVDAQSKVTGFVSIRRDITKRKQAERQLVRSQAFLANVADVASVGGWSLDLATDAVYWSQQTKRIHEVSDDYQPDLNTAIEFYKPEARPAITHAVENSLTNGEGWDLELPMTTAKGRDIWARAVGKVLLEDGEPVSLVGAFQDITERKMAEAALRGEVTHRHAAEQLLLDVLETIPGAVAAYDEDDKLIVCNSGYLKAYAVSADAIYPGAHFEDILRTGLARGQYHGVGADEASQAKWLEERLEAHRNPPDEMNQKLRDGTWLQVRERVSQTGTTVGVRTDITALKRAEAKLRKFAEEDQLTGLFNRARFCDALENCLDAEREKVGRNAAGLSAAGGCVALFDIDHFKPINDAYGHDVGDEVLVEVAARVARVLGHSDVAARLGGDEFVFYLTADKDKAQCEATITALFDAFDIAINTAAGDVHARISLGVTHLDGGSSSPRDLLKRADMAQYRAKQDGRGTWRWFDIKDWDELNKQSVMAKAMAQAVNQRDGLSFALQPLAGADDGTALGFSSEIAWSFKDHTHTTSTVHELAQKGNQGARLCNMQLKNAFKQMGSHSARGIDCGLLWVTVSAEQLRLDQFANTLNHLRQEFDIPADRLVIAIDEAAFGERSNSAMVQTLHAIQAHGMGIGIDNFGLGGCSVAQLQSIGVRAVRLACSLSRDEDQNHAVLGLIKVAGALGIDVYADGVDSAQDRERLTALGCSGLQGTVIGPYLVNHDLTAYLADSAARQLARLALDVEENRSTPPANKVA